LKLLIMRVLRLLQRFLHGRIERARRIVALQDLVSRDVSSLKSLISLSSHDMKNHIQSLAFNLSKVRDKFPPEWYEEQKKIVMGLLNSIDTLTTSGRLKINLGNLCSTISEKIGVQAAIGFHIPKNTIVESYPIALASILRNILQNSKEAFDRRHIASPCRSISLAWDPEGKILTIRDNAGGFDVSKIKEGVSTKRGRGHGVFCHLVTTMMRDFDLEVRYAKILHGTAVEVRFLKA